MPVPLPGDIARVQLWVQVLTGAELDEHGVVHTLDSAEWAERKERLRQWGGDVLP